MTQNRWQRKAEALARLAEDQRGKPEGELARQKLLEIINRHPGGAQYEPIVELARRDIDWVMTGAHLVEMKQADISLDGTWKADTMEGAIKVMVRDYQDRYLDHFEPIERLMIGGSALAGEAEMIA
jgi:hypothetical protein